MRIIQLIDSLDAGGAEKMAVNYANSLAKQIAFSGLVTTRKQGALQSQINSEVAYLYLRKKTSVDIGAIFRLRKFCKSNQVTVIHAHGTSFFIGVLLKFVMPSINLIWHDHNGDRDAQHKLSNKILWFSSIFFSGVIVVNQKLKQWMVNELRIANVVYLPNYTVADHHQVPETRLEGTNQKRILHLANLRNPKNHLLLISVGAKLKESHPDWTLHMVGKDSDDSYSTTVKDKIKRLGLDKTVYICGQKNDVGNIINQASICVLSSTYEGLPVALLEYGICAKAVVVTAVGEMPHIIANGANGLIVPSENADAFYIALTRLIDDPELRNALGAALQQTVMRDHSENAVISKYLSWLQQTKSRT